MMPQSKKVCLFMAVLLAVFSAAVPPWGTKVGALAEMDLSRRSPWAKTDGSELIKRIEGPAEESYINFSFDQVDVSAFVKLVGDITGRKFVLAEGVEGKITVISPRVRRKEVYPLFVSILESAGCSVIEDGKIYRVVALPQRVTPTAPVVGIHEVTPAEGVVTKVIRLEHVSATELRRVLESKVGGGKTGAIGAIEETNHLIVTDTAHSIRRIEKIVSEIDRPGLARMTEVVPLEFAGSEDLARELNLAMAESESRGERLRRRLPAVPGRRATSRQSAVVVASPHSNSLILVGTQSQLSELRRVIKQMDVDTPSGRGRLNAIFLKYISAEDAAKNISALLNKSVDKNAPKQRSIAIEASPANNALLVDASPGDYDVVKKLVEQIDLAPQQVQIEVLIAERSASTGLDLGVEMAAVDAPEEVGATVLQAGSRLGEGADSLMSTIQQGVFPRGITLGVVYGTRKNTEGHIVPGFPGMININAIKKSGKFNIRSNPTLVTQNNKEASVSIVNDIPILESTVRGAGADRDVIETIKRMEVGIKLKLTPRVISGREIQMQLNQSIEAVSEPGLMPIIAKRVVDTTVRVPDGKMIIIAGLTREDKTKIVKRVPILGSIPLLGWLFRHTVEGTDKTDVLIFVTPRIVTEMASADAVMRDWQEKTGVSTHEEE